MRRPRATPKLASKLLAIRLWKKMSQTEILQLVEPSASKDQRALVSQWERSSREPRRQTLIRYARIAEISLEDLLCDERSLLLHITNDSALRNNAPNQETEQTKPFCKKQNETCKASTLNEFPNCLKPSEKKLFDSKKSIEQEHLSITDISPNTSSKSEKGADIFTEDQIDFNEYKNILLLSENELAESIEVEFPSALLDAIDDIHLQILMRLPRRKRPLVSPADLVIYSLRVMMEYYTDHKLGRLLEHQIRNLLDEE